MAKIQIDYDPIDVEAILTADQADHDWDVILRTIRELTSELVESASRQVRIPWWIFVNSRRALAYQIAIHDIQVDFGSHATALLGEANVRDGLLDSAASTPELKKDHLDSVLRTSGFIRELKPFQSENLLKLCRLPVGASFSVPGSGKTTEALAFFSYFRRTDSRLLVVAPKNAFAAWEEQTGLCLPTSDKFVRLTGGKAAIEDILRIAQPHLMLITYEQFPTVSKLLAQYLARFHNFMFLDESHRIKGGARKIRANAILRIAPVAKHKLVLSGTPLPNGEADLVPQFEFIAPEIAVQEDTVTAQVAPFFVRTTKRDLKLPEPKRVLVPLSMNEEQRRLYELLRSAVARNAEKEIERDARRAFRAIGRSAVRLLQYVSNPSLLVGKIPEFDEYLGQVIEEGDSPKLEWATLRARQLARQGQKVIIWSSFVQNVELLAARLADLGASFIHGGVDASSEADADSREARILRFHKDPSAMVLVANPAACGEGISLHTVCDHAIYVDRNYNAAQYLQSEDRIHRIGSDHQKYVEIVVCRDSIDLAVDRRLQAKIEKMAVTLNDPSLQITPIPIDADRLDLDDDDVLDLLAHLRAAREVAA
jgi:SNF2 family DNA or RNA helicase